MDAERTITPGAANLLEAVPIASGIRALDAVPALAEALSGRRSLLPVPADDATRADTLRRSQRAGEPIAADVALVACTSGSTGTPKGAMLTPGNLRASIDATHARLGGPGQWLLATPPAHIAGLQVLLRTIRAGEEPIAMELDDGFRPGALARAIGRMTGRRRYTSLVPLQLGRVLDDPGATAALASLDGVLCGGQATSPALLDRARAAGVRVVTSYGSSETSGGVVYDGVALGGADVTVADDGRIVIAGPMVARGYRGIDAPELRPESGTVRTTAGAGSATAAGVPASGVFRTSDAGRLDDGTLTVLGRIDDVIISGGLKFLPGPIEDALTALDDVADAAVVGLPHPELGHAVVAAVTVRDGATPSSATAMAALENRLRDALAATMDKHQVPRAVFVVTHLPTLATGKLDRAGLADALAPRWEMMSE